MNPREPPLPRVPRVRLRAGGEGRERGRAFWPGESCAHVSKDALIDRLVAGHFEDRRDRFRLFHLGEFTFGEAVIGLDADGRDRGRWRQRL